MIEITNEIKMLLIQTRPHTDAQAVWDNIKNADGINEEEAFQERLNKFLRDNSDLGSWGDLDDDGNQEFTPPTYEEVKARLIEKRYQQIETPQPWQIEGFESKSDWEAKEYSRNRASEYPSIVDQLDDIYHNGIDAWKAKIKAVKDKYPKE